MRERCIADECNRLPRKGIKYCDKHTHLMPKSVHYKDCAFEGCGRRAIAVGHCGPHREQVKQGKELRPLRHKPDRFDCEFEGCGRPHKVRGLCSSHHAQRQKGDDLKPISIGGRSRKAAPPPPKCSFDGCDRPARSRAAKGRLCAGHLDQERRGVEKLFPLNSRRRGSGHVNVGGYRIIHVNGTNMPEHRAVMEQAIGRPLLRRESVHHINGDKLDNRIDNLELWVSAHLKGQRVEDLVDFVVNTYPELVEKRLSQPLLFVA
jgi:hypothetical protein